MLRPAIPVPLLAALGLAAAACGVAPGERPAAASSAAEVVIDPSTACSVSGRIVYDGPAPAPVPIDLSADPACAREHPQPVYAQDLLVGPERGLRNALVWIEAGAPEGRYPLPDATPRLNQAGCLYEPRVLAVRLGQPLEISNGDATFHNVHAIPKDNREWNRSQVPGGDSFDETFAREEIGIPLRCNVHPWMRAYVSVLRHPFFDVTGEDGRYAIAGLPPGEYTLAVWHEKLGTRERRLALAARESASVDFTFGVGGAS